jgi:hypothetical protein
MKWVSNSHSNTSWWIRSKKGSEIHDFQRQRTWIVSRYLVPRRFVDSEIMHIGDFASEVEDEVEGRQLSVITRDEDDASIVSINLVSRSLIWYLFEDDPPW